jgi:hypothetical protein
VARDWFVDPGLEVLRNQLKVAYPGIVIGTIGDAEHSSRTSDHNPDPDGSVDAIDPMIGKAFTPEDAGEVVNALVRSRDERIAYIIWDRRIISSTAEPWVWRKFTGDDPHTNHFHLSVNDKHHENRKLWRINMPDTKVEYQDFGVHMPILHEGISDEDYPGWNLIVRVQDYLGVAVDGDYGPRTAKALAQHFGGDGSKIDEKIWRQIFGLANVPK